MFSKFGQKSAWISQNKIHSMDEDIAEDPTEMYSQAGNTEQTVLHHTLQETSNLQLCALQCRSGKS